LVLDSLGIMVAARDPIYSKRHTIYEAPPAYTCHVKINLGCGLDKRPGYINVDIRKEMDRARATMAGPTSSAQRGSSEGYAPTRS
jgi:hypothetical protein